MQHLQSNGAQSSATNPGGNTPEELAVPRPAKIAEMAVAPSQADKREFYRATFGASTNTNPAADQEIQDGLETTVFAPPAVEKRCKINGPDGIEMQVVVVTHENLIKSGTNASEANIHSVTQVKVVEYESKWLGAFFKVKTVYLH